MTRLPLRLLLGTEQPCGYLPKRLSRSAFVAPQITLNGPIYSALLAQGFRRSGDYAYRPACTACKACVPVRLPAALFRPSRSQRRCLARNADLDWQRCSVLTDEHFALYRKYLLARHPFGGMDADDAKAFREFLGTTWGISEFWAFREAGVLRMVAVVDVLPDGLSAVYTFYDPDCATRGLGTYAVLKQIERARELALPYLYLGYWVAGSPTMDYKRHFEPLEQFDGHEWAPLSTSGMVTHCPTRGGAP